MFDGPWTRPGTSGYINDPQLPVHNIQRAAEAKGAKFRFKQEVIEIRHQDGHVLGITLQGAEEIDAPVVVNAVGPHSFVINKMAKVDKSMKVDTRALRHEVHYVPVPVPVEFEYETHGHVTSDNDIGAYCDPKPVIYCCWVVRILIVIRRNG